MISERERGIWFCAYLYSYCLSFPHLYQHLVSRQWMVVIKHRYIAYADSLVLFQILSLFLHG